MTTEQQVTLIDEDVISSDIEDYDSVAWAQVLEHSITARAAIAKARGES